MEKTPPEEFAARRQRVLEALKDDVMIVFSGQAKLRNNDVEFDFRQDSDFYYLTGFEEPDAALVLRQGEPDYVLFVRPRNRERETWDGRRVGIEGATSRLGAKVAYSSADIAEPLADLIEDRTRVHVVFGASPLVDPRVECALEVVRGRRRKRVKAPSEIVDARGILHELRLVKTEREVLAMRAAAEITCAGHLAAMQACCPEMNEFDLQNVVEAEFRRRGARRVAYSSIVGGGENATILHYRENESELVDGDLVLIDAGAEYNYYAGDVTRTFPVSGRFSPFQRQAYEVVLAAQLAAIEACRAGSTLEEIHERAVEQLLSGALRIGLLDRNSRDLRHDLARYYMHRTSHFLGMDVHDVGSYYLAGEPRPLGPGMVITVEPGLYIAADDELAPPEFRGLGIRIEDDVLITAGDPDVLTRSAPKTVAEIEAACRGEGSRSPA